MVNYDKIRTYLKALEEELDNAKSLESVGFADEPIKYVIVYPLITDQILLVLKNKPDYMVGKLNLIGGKIEEGETPIEAGIRELKEESGFTATDMEFCGKIIGNNCVIYCMSCFIKPPGNVRDGWVDWKKELNPRSEETEVVNFYWWHEVKNDPRLVPNLRVIIPLLEAESKGWTIIDKDRSQSGMKHKIIVELE